jgi:hypothetical protein
MVRREWLAGGSVWLRTAVQEDAVADGTWNVPATLGWLPGLSFAVGDGGVTAAADFVDARKSNQQH